MMVQKALYFEDLETAKKIIESQSPSEQKQLGRSVKEFNSDEWGKVSERFVYIANKEKFKEKLYRKYLLETGDSIIAEAGPTDTIWGIGLSEDDPKALDPTQWRGENRLGKILVRVRQEIQDEISGIVE